jgi:hypothetical protein
MLVLCLIVSERFVLLWMAAALTPLYLRAEHAECYSPLTSATAPPWAAHSIESTPCPVVLLKNLRDTVLGMHHHMQGVVFALFTTFRALAGLPYGRP